MWKTIMVSVASVALTLLVIVGVAWAGNIFTVDKDGTVRLVITDAGNVGVGTATPDQNIHVYSAANSARAVVIDSQGVGTTQQGGLQFITLGDGSKSLDAEDPGTKGWYFSARGNAYTEVAGQQNDLGVWFWNGVSWLSRFYLQDNTGSIGIGTDSPLTRLDINNTSGTGGIRIRNTKTPTGTADISGNIGDIAWDENYLYVKTGAGWKRTALATW